MIGRILIILIGILCCRPGRQAPYDFLQNLRSQLPARSLSPLDDIGVEGLRDSIEDVGYFACHIN